MRTYSKISPTVSKPPNHTTTNVILKLTEEILPPSRRTQPVHERRGHFLQLYAAQRGIWREKRGYDELAVGHGWTRKEQRFGAGAIPSFGLAPN